MSTSNMAWIDASAVMLGCIGFSKNKQSHLIPGHRRSGLSWIAAHDVCKKANPKAHLIEIFNGNQSRFLMSETVRKQLITHLGIDTHNRNPFLPYGTYWWIGAELKSGTWYWEHSKKQVTYWSKIGGNSYDTSKFYPYCALVYISKTSAYWNYDHCFKNQQYSSICQISVMNK